MGNEATCRVEIDGKAADAKVVLETEELIVRGRPALKIAFREAKNVAANDGVLTFRSAGRDIRIHLGKQAEKWADKIRNPKSVVDKLGVKPGQRISIAGPLDPSFLGDLDVSPRVREDSDVIFLAANHRDDLGRLPKLREALRPTGAIWVIRPKGVPDITEAEVMAAGKAAGLVDVKVVRFSTTHTAEKLVIPVTER